MNKNQIDDILVVDEELVDINYSHSRSGENYNNRNSGKKGPENKDRKKKIIIISSIAAALVVALGITGFCIFGGKIAPDLLESEFVFSEGTSVSGLSISGKTMEEAQSILTANKKSFIKPVSITVDADGEITELSEADFDYTYDIDSVLSMIKSEETATGNTSETKTYTVTATVTDESVESNAKTIADETDKEAQNARVSKFTPFAEERFEYEEAVTGLKLNRQDLTKQLKTAVMGGDDSASITADVDKIDAKISIDDLKNNIVKLSAYMTVSYNTANGTSNMKVSLAACNGSVIEPGDVWSFNDCTGNSNLESNGYKSAGVIENGKHTEGIGGGICQSSSTIYNAALRANLQVEERHNHKWASSYVPTGLDATIDYGNLDLKLSNPTDYQMFLECKLVDTRLYVAFWGYKSPSYDEIKLYNEMTDKSGDDYTVKAWRAYFKDGEEINRESLGSSTYDIENGYVFIEADNDENFKEPSESESSERSEASSSSSRSSSSSKPQSSATSKPTSKPVPTKPKPKPTKPHYTEPITTKPVHTEPDTTQPQESSVLEED